MRRDVFKKLLSLPISYFDKTAVGTNTTRTVNDLETVNPVFRRTHYDNSRYTRPSNAIDSNVLYKRETHFLICLVSFPLLLVASYIFKEKVKASFTKEVLN